MVKKTGNFLITKLKTPCPNRWNAELKFPNIQKTAIIRVHKWLLIWNIFYQRILTAVWTPNIASHWMILFENVSIERKKLIEAIASYFQYNYSLQKLHFLKIFRRIFFKLKQRVIISKIWNYFGYCLYQFFLSIRISSHNIIMVIINKQQLIRLYKQKLP